LENGGLVEVNGSRFVADSELAAKIRGALKIVRAPGRLALSKNMGNGGRRRPAGRRKKWGPDEIRTVAIGHRAGRLKMTTANSGAEPKFRPGIISLH
jgi:hypothetical protein